MFGREFKPFQNTCKRQGFDCRMAPARVLALLSMATFCAGILPGNAGAQLYVSDTNNTIRLYSTSGSPLNTSFITGLNGPRRFVVSDGRLFVVNSLTGAVGEYDATTGAPINANLIPGAAGNPSGRFDIA